jgi:hypothetical protein
MLYTIEQLREVLLILHLFGVVIGFGGAVVTDRLFFHFLRDLRISRQESVVLKYVSQIIWAGIALIFLTGTLLFIPSASELLAAPICHTCRQWSVSAFFHTPDHYKNQLQATSPPLRRITLVSQARHDFRRDFTDLMDGYFPLGNATTFFSRNIFFDRVCLFPVCSRRFVDGLTG